jgi:hypothetical protein
MPRPTRPDLLAPFGHGSAFTPRGAFTVGRGTLFPRAPAPLRWCWCVHPRPPTLPFALLGYPAAVVTQRSLSHGFAPPFTKRSSGGLTVDNIIEVVSFALATLLFLYAGLAPAFEGRPPNVIFLGLAVLSIILVIVFWKKGNRASGPPSH